MIRLFFAGLAALFLNGCAVSGSTFNIKKIAPKNKALVYIYRPNTIVASLAWNIPYLFVDGKRVGKIRINGHYALELAPGKRVFEIKQVTNLGEIKKKAQLRNVFHVKAGSTNYLKYEFTVTPAGYRLERHRYSLIKVDAASAVERINGTKQMKPYEKL